MRLKEERERLKLSQTALGELAGAAKRTVIDWEKGVSSPTAVQLSTLSEHGADVLYILTGVRLQTATEAKPTNQREAALLDNYRNTPESLKRNAEETLSAFAQLQSKKKASGE